MSIFDSLEELFSEDDNSKNQHQFLIDKTIQFLKTDVKIIELSGSNLSTGPGGNSLEKRLESENHDIKIKFNLLNSSKIDRNEIDSVIPYKYTLTYSVSRDFAEGAAELIEVFFGTNMGKKKQSFIFHNLATNKRVELNVSQNSIDQLMDLLIKIENILKNNLM